jgi:predicted DNA-binding protein with PD1-like motif
MSVTSVITIRMAEQGYARRTSRNNRATPGVARVMRSQLLHETGGLRTWVVVLDSGEEATASLQSFVDAEAIEAAQLTGIGAFRRATLGYYNWEAKAYRRNEVEEQVEVASLIGDVAVAPDGKRALHIHLVLGRQDGSALAGHLLAGTVRPTLEVIVTEAPAHLRKRHDSETGLLLISPAG